MMVNSINWYIMFFANIIYFSEKSFEEMAEKMENFYQQVDNRLTKLKNLYLEMNSQVEFQILTEDTVLADVSNSINANPGNIHSNETFQPKSEY